MSTHARLSPSSAHRWMHCYGSVKLSEQFPETSSVYADEGTAAHTLAERALTYSKDAAFFIGETITVGETGFVVDEDMAAAVQMYLDYVRREGEGKPMLFEQSLPLTPLTGEEGAFGTADAVIMDGNTLTIIDLKYGRGEEVDATDNEQLMMYAAAARLHYELVGDFTKFKVVIVQPRRDHIDDMDFDDKTLNDFCIKIGVAADRISTASEVYTPGDKTCLWCKAKAVCPALKAKVEALVSNSFDNLESAPQVDLSDSMKFTDLVEDWSRAVRAEVERRLTNGVPVPGYKLVQGRMGARQWSDKGAAEDKLKNQMRYADDIIFSKALLSPTQLEKKLSKDHPKHWGELQSLIVRKEGPPSVAEESDVRPALSSTTNSFEVIE